MKTRSVMNAGYQYRRHLIRMMPATTMRQSGAVLFFALIALTVLMLSAIAMVRSVDTALGAAGNMTFKQGTIQEGDSGVEAAFKALAISTIADKTQDDSARGYYAAYDPAVDMPHARLGAATDMRGASGNKVRYVIERMCLSAGAADPDSCLQPPLINNNSKASGHVVFGEEKVYYRVTVRISGPRNTSSVVQAILAI